jgi:hypothetical protein
MTGDETRRSLSHPEYAFLSEEGSSKLAWRRVMFWERRASKLESFVSEDV